MKHLKRYNERYSFANQLGLNDEDLKLLDEMEEFYNSNRQEVLECIIDLCDVVGDYEVQGCVFLSNYNFKEVSLRTSFGEKFTYKFLLNNLVPPYHVCKIDLFHMSKEDLNFRWEYLIKKEIAYYKEAIKNGDFEMGFRFPNSGEFLSKWVNDQNKIDILYEANEQLKSIGWETYFYNLTKNTRFDHVNVAENHIFFRKIK